MNDGWKIIYYQTINGDYPVKEFIDHLNSKAKSKIINAIDLLGEFGIRLSLPHSKRMSRSNLWELRILGKNNIRILYVAIIGKTFLLLHGFQKKKQKTDRRDIKIAESRLEYYKLRLK